MARNYVISVERENGMRARCGMGGWSECRADAAELSSGATIHVAEFGALTRNPDAPALYAGPAGDIPAACPDPLDAVDAAIDVALDAMDADAPDLDAIAAALRGALAALEGGAARGG